MPVHISTLLTRNSKSQQTHLHRILNKVRRFLINHLSHFPMQSTSPARHSSSLLPISQKGTELKGSLALLHAGVIFRGRSSTGAECRYTRRPAEYKGVSGLAGWLGSGSHRSPISAVWCDLICDEVERAVVCTLFLCFT